MILRDLLYGAVTVPTELVPFLRIPELVRLRGVRLSNVDSIEFKDLNGPSRWEHAVGVLHLASLCADTRGMADVDRLHLQLAALLHDVATPPFAHTAEYVLADYDHELETSRLLAERTSEDVAPGATVFSSEISRFRDACRTLARETRTKIDPDEVARMVIGEGDNGFLISGTLDLDNADNVTRASLCMGIEVDRHVPERLAKYLAHCDSAPLSLETSEDPDIRCWLTYRREMYGAFYGASSVEHGREAFLQHLFRKAVDLGVSRRSLVWNTDEGFLGMLECLHDERRDPQSQALRESVRRYRLLEDPFPVLSLDLYSADQFRALKSPDAASWIERELTTPSCESIVSIPARRFEPSADADQLIEPAVGQFEWFKLGHGIVPSALPAWLQAEVSPHLTGHRLLLALQRAVRAHLGRWATEKPWLVPSTNRTERARERLEAMGDWSFRQTRNASLHTYPSTFVHAIPASLIHALGIAGELVVDPFGGTGNTAVEAVKAGGSAISGDSNLIATLIAKVRLTYLDVHQRKWISDVSSSSADHGGVLQSPAFPQIEKWHHPATLDELCRIRHFVLSIDDPAIKNFASIAFSAILPNTTARRGEQHGFFADNTPLAKGMLEPPYVDAVQLFVDRLHRNLTLVEATFASLERDGRDVQSELARAHVVRVDARQGAPADYGIEPGSAAAIVTSPPYVGMTDYTLGHRLSYHWLFPESFGTDFEAELGARRMRLRVTPQTALKNYVDGIAEFAQSASRLIRPGGYLALVLGKPMARAFAESDVLGMVDDSLAGAGFTPVWNTWRSISWSRNHSYRRLTTERLSVHQLHQ